MIKKGNLNQDFLDKLPLESDKAHNNRQILFKLLGLEEVNTFSGLVDGLRKTGCARLANILENKLETIIESNILHPLDVNIDVKFSTQFYDTERYNRTGFYSTRSKNRGYVLIINNINFAQSYDERHGAEADERNLRQLFEKMGLTVFCYRDLNAYDMYFKTREFSEKLPVTQPDIGIVIIMSHGLVINNETMIVSSDNKYLAEESFKKIFNNENCALFRRKPKIFIYHICRNVLRESVTKQTFTDAILGNSLRTYSDMLICHPSVKGFSAYRNSIKGSWYIQLLCKVFMEHAHDMDIESLLRKVDEELEVVSSMPWVTENPNEGTQQTSTFQNIAFKKCYLHPGLYEEDGKMMKFPQNQ
ncbi:caspase Dronc isoform X2 [Tribolium castaneum]